MKRNDGYSLVELMMVVGIIGVVAASAIPSLSKREPQRQIQETAWQLYMDLQQAKSRAISENQAVTISVNNSLDQYTIWTDSNGNGIREADEKEVKDLSDTPEADLYAFPSTVVFNPSGTVSSSSYCFYMRVMVPDAGYKFIYVFPNGHIDPMKIQKADG